MAKKHPPKRDHFIAAITHGKSSVTRQGKDNAIVSISSRKISVEVQSIIEQRRDNAYVKFYLTRTDGTNMPSMLEGVMKATVVDGQLHLTPATRIVRAITLDSIEAAMREDKEYAQKIRALVFTNLDAAQ